MCQSPILLTFSLIAYHSKVVLVIKNPSYPPRKLLLFIGDINLGFVKPNVVSILICHNKRFPPCFIEDRRRKQKRD